MTRIVIVIDVEGNVVNLISDEPIEVKCVDYSADLHRCNGVAPDGFPARLDDYPWQEDVQYVNEVFDEKTS